MTQWWDYRIIRAAANHLGFVYWPLVLPLIAQQMQQKWCLNVWASPCHDDDTTSLNIAISHFIRQGHEIGKSIRAGKQDKQFKVHSMSALLLTLILRGMLLTYTIRAPGSEMSTIRQQWNLWSSQVIWQHFSDASQLSPIAPLHFSHLTSYTLYHVPLSRKGWWCDVWNVRCEEWSVWWEVVDLKCEVWFGKCEICWARSEEEVLWFEAWCGCCLK